MIIEVDADSALPPYEQIRRQLMLMIDSGTLPAGARLPSIRQLAADLGLAPGTVARAYRELEAGNYLHSRIGRGTTAADRPTLTGDQRTERLRRAAHDFATTVAQLGVGPEQAREAIDAALQAR